MYEDLRQRLIRALQRASLALANPPSTDKREILELDLDDLEAFLQGMGPWPSAVSREGAAPPGADPRILRQVGKLRLVAPALRTDGRNRYLNGTLLIECRDTDALGIARWLEVRRVQWPGPGAGYELEQALFRLLAGDGWDDRELREYDK